MQHPRTPYRHGWQWWHIVNYAARLVLIIAGLALAFGWIPVPETSAAFVSTFGLVMALFGVYRLVSYHWRLRRWQPDDPSRLL